MGTNLRVEVLTSLHYAPYLKGLIEMGVRGIVDEGADEAESHYTKEDVLDAFNSPMSIDEIGELFGIMSW